ncbi:MAG: hypothetical protein WCJ30_09040 [Deltaproteobacteria bacterium]
MQTEINGITTRVPIRIFGVNQVGLEVGNATFTAGRSIPWLQEGTALDVWTLWGVTYRDVVILDTRNYRVDVYNLTANDLAIPANYAALRDLLLSHAR